jgi:hypothetical protein
MLREINVKAGLLVMGDEFERFCYGLGGFTFVIPTSSFAGFVTGCFSYGLAGFTFVIPTSSFAN